MDNNNAPELRRISYGELHLMMTRLCIDIKEHPDWYDTGDGITEFIRQENFRRELFVEGSKIA